MFIKTLLISLAIILAPQKEAIKVTIVKSEKSKDSSTETTIYEIKPGSVSYKYVITGRRAKQEVKSAELTPQEYQAIRNKYIELQLNQNRNEVSTEEGMFMLEIRAIAKLDALYDLHLSGSSAVVKAGKHYKPVQKFVDWLKSYKQL